MLAILVEICIIKPMIQETFINNNGEFQLFIHGKNSVSVRNENLVVNGIPYSVHAHFEVADMIFTLSNLYVTRTDTWQKEATYAQKQRCGEVAKREAFDYIFSYPHLLIEGEKSRVEEKMKSLKAERDELHKKAAEKNTEILEFWEANRQVFGNDEPLIGGWLRSSN
jgi:hypothetical protein